MQDGLQQKLENATLEDQQPMTKTISINFQETNQDSLICKQNFSQDVTQKRLELFELEKDELQENSVSKREEVKDQEQDEENEEYKEEQEEQNEDQKEQTDDEDDIVEEEDEDEVEDESVKK